MAKRASANSPGKRAAPNGAADPLAESINRATAEIAMLRQVIDEVREDFSWLIRNGLPVQPIEHVHVKRMAIDPLADNWNEQLEIERSILPTKATISPLDSDALDRVAEDLKTAFEAVTQGQLEIVLTALDGVRAEIVTALKRRVQEPESPANSPATPMPRPPTGRLF